MKTKKLKFLIAGIFMAIVSSACEEDVTPDDFRDQLVGTWNVTEENNLKSVDYYTVTISKSSVDTSKIRITNFYAIDGSVVVTINGSYLTIPEQSAEGFTFQGFGDLDLKLKEIQWSYTVNHNNGFIDHVTATYKKK